MPGPVNAFLWIFVLISLFGLLVGTLNLMNPAAVHIPFGPNGESAEGLDGVIASVLSSGVLGIFFGCIAAFFAWLFRTGVNRANKDTGNENEN